ncbi:MAG: hypothetical protein ACRCWI_01145 [Brevinema sp.]
MKNISILLLILISGLGYSQTNIQAQNQKKLIPPYFSIYTIFGGVSTLANGGSPCHTVPTMWLIFEGHIPIGYQNLYLYTQFRSSFFIGQSNSIISAILPIIHMESTKLGVLLGVGGIVYDQRKNNIGWYISLNGGIVFEGAVRKFPTSNPLNPDIPERFLNIGTEINTIFYYNFKKYFGLNIGFHWGYTYSPFSGDSFYLGLPNQIVFFHMMSYGISFGMNF